MTMTAAILDRLLSQKTRDGWVCPKCRHGMEYMPLGSSAMYVCHACHWMQHQSPARGKIIRDEVK